MLYRIDDGRLVIVVVQAGRRREIYREGVRRQYSPLSVASDPQRARVTDRNFGLTADREREDRRGVAEIGIGEHRQAYKNGLFGHDQRQQFPRHSACLLKATYHQTPYARCLRRLQKRRKVPRKCGRVAFEVILQEEQRSNSLLLNPPITVRIPATS